jgi:hypothetical protein
MITSATRAAPPRTQSVAIVSAFPPTSVARGADDATTSAPIAANNPKQYTMITLVLFMILLITAKYQAADEGWLGQYNTQRHNHNTQHAMVQCMYATSGYARTSSQP